MVFLLDWWCHMELSNLLIGVGSTVLGFVISFLTLSRDKEKDIRSDAEKQATINVKLDNINTGVQSLHTDIKAEQKARAELSERVTRVEESTKQAHRRIDEIEKG